MRVLHVVGARPNFMKIAPIIHALAARSNMHQVLVHTGQHDDQTMSDVFLEELRIPKPDLRLDVRERDRDGRITQMLDGLRRVLRDLTPDSVVVVGDVDSTRAGALAASASSIPCAHVEAGLRSFDTSMPEERNRVLIDRESELLFAPSPDAVRNLLDEGAPEASIHMVGNVMIDTLRAHLTKAKRRPVLDELGLSVGQYAVATLHRPANVDSKPTLRRILDTLGEVGAALPLVVPLHPRTAAQIEKHGLSTKISTTPGVQVTGPLGYLDFVGLVSQAKLVLTDSGGLQEETTALGIPCLTLRDTTERPVTVEVGTNTLVGTDRDRILREVVAVLEGRAKRGTLPELWDGRASERIADTLIRRFAEPSAKG